MKKCNKCNEIKSLECFYIGKEYKDGYRSICIECLRSHMRNLYASDKDKYRNRKRQWAVDNPEKYKAKSKKWNDANKDKNRESVLRRKFGLTLEDYSTMLKNQDNKCKICKIDQSLLSKNMYLDHCHKTGKVRGLLCNQCNSGIGLLKDSIIVLESAIKYLKESV
jgi:hypothetical protein